VHLRVPHQQKLGTAVSGEVQLQLLSEKEVIATATVPVTCKGIADLDALFHQPLPAGFYKVSAVYIQGGHAREFFQNGFLVTDRGALASGPVLGIYGDFLTLDGKPFFPVGTNYFTEENGWDFSGPRNAWIWDKDFAEMAAFGVSFVRTGVWMPNGKLIEGNTGGANERFLRDLKAFLDCAQRNNIAINFTFFAFSPQSGGFPRNQDAAGTPPNPYTDPVSVGAEQAYVRSLVERFKDVPWLLWDLINEPSFSNPRQVFKENYPNCDPTEIAAWHKWLSQKDANLSALGDAWRVPAPLSHAVRS
jgi:hypothetical protein